MDGSKRREMIVKLLGSTKKPHSGSSLAKELGVSRQIIVSDIALLRANGEDILSTNQGYVLNIDTLNKRVFKVQHSDDDTEKELNIFVDNGATVHDVFVYHKVYGVVKSELNIHSRLDIEKYVDDIKSGKSRLLKNITSDFHYHTVSAKNEEVLDLIQNKLEQCGFLAQLQDYEPVNFWGEEVEE